MKQLPLPAGITSQQVSSVNGLSMHVLTAGKPEDPCIMLLHGFPDLAYGWRHVMQPIAEQGYYVIAPDQRGYGRTTGWNPKYDTDIREYNMINLSKDMVALLYAMKIKKLHCLVGHDFGSPVAAYMTLLRPDLIDRLVCMSAPFPGAPRIDHGAKPSGTLPDIDLDIGLKDLVPPRKHYQAYNSTAQANEDMLNCKQGLHEFLRAYYHVKSADWPANDPRPLDGWNAQALSEMPHYYVMPQELTMPEAVLNEFPKGHCAWLTDADLDVYVDEFKRTQFQGALNWYRCSNSGSFRAELSVFYGKKINTPTWYITGSKDWGTYQTPGALERMERAACGDFRGTVNIANAGHWVQQEQVSETTQHILKVCKAN